MADSASLDANVFAPLRGLNQVRSGGAATYYGALLKLDDEVIRAGAWLCLLEAGAVAPSQHEALLPFCRYGAVRKAAFDYFRKRYDHALALRAARTPAAAGKDDEQQLLIASATFDPAATAVAEQQLYLGTGEVDHLRRAMAQADTSGGWEAALPIGVRALALYPANPQVTGEVFALLDNARRADLIEDLAAIFTAVGMNLPINQVFLASAALIKGDPALALKRLERLGGVKLEGPLSPLLAIIARLRAESLDKLGDYRKAYEAYVELNRLDRDKSVDPKIQYKATIVRGRLPIPALPTDARTDCVQMVGFPRSGTTLLENALAAHPLIETFEEIPSQNAAIDAIERALVLRPAERPPEVDIYLAARERYYAEIDARRKKPAAPVLIDKLPIGSGDAAFLGKLFPEQRFVFSVRHPMDVVLSCFRQRFVPNPAMENFHTIADAARLYDFVMSQWFSVHSLDDPRVCYVRYERLVTDFEAQLRTVLDFLRLEWSDEVLSFAEQSGRRAARTPSYQKVRQGLGIGVQTAWRNYAFAFQPEAGKVLRKWVDFFGYEA